MTFHAGRRISDINWGGVEIDFTLPDPVVSLTIRNTAGEVVQEHKYSTADKGGRREYCKVPDFQKRVGHITSTFGVLCLPFVLFGIALVIVLRKWSYSF